MNPIVNAQRVCQGGTKRPFAIDLRLHLMHGYVISTPVLFAMGRPIRHDAPMGEVLDITQQFEDPDCWFIWSAAGVLSELVYQLPFELPLIAFHRAGRGDRLRFYQLERFTEIAARTMYRPSHKLTIS
jgi:hypothetical protein